MKINRIAGGLLPVVLWTVAVAASATAWARAAQSDRRATQAERLVDQISARALDMVRTSLAGVGMRPEWERLVKVQSTSDTPVVGLPKLVLALSESACDECQARELQFANFIASKLGPEFVVAIVSAADQRFVEALVKHEKPQFDVFFDDGATFTHSIGTGIDQILLLLDSNGVVIAAHAPVAGANEYAEPFHETAYRYILDAKNLSADKR